MKGMLGSCWNSKLHWQGDCIWYKVEIGDKKEIKTSKRKLHMEVLYDAFDLSSPIINTWTQRVNKSKRNPRKCCKSTPREENTYTSQENAYLNVGGDVGRRPSLTNSWTQTRAFIIKRNVGHGNRVADWVAFRSIAAQLRYSYYCIINTCLLFD